MEELKKVLNPKLATEQSNDGFDKPVREEQIFGDEKCAVQQETPTIDTEFKKRKDAKPDADFAIKDEEEGEVKRECSYTETEQKLRLKKSIKKKHECDVCGKMFNSKHALGPHKNIHKNESVAGHSCNICDKSFFRISALKRHQKSHGDNTSQCDVCGDNLSTRKPKGAPASDYDKHMRIHKVLNFRCDCTNVPVLEEGDEYGIKDKYISKTFVAKEQHMKRVHQGWHGCDLCSTSFKTMETLQKHLAKHNIKCAQCNYIAKNKSFMQKHINSVHDPQESECKICKEAFKNVNLLRSHMKFGHKEATTCDLCGETFKNIEMHKKTKHQTDEEKRYKCGQCGKGFGVKDYLKVHEMNMHIKSRPFQCRYGCENRYNDSGNRAAHEKRRHGQTFR